MKRAARRRPSNVAGAADALVRQPASSRRGLLSSYFEALGVPIFTVPLTGTLTTGLTLSLV